MRKAAILAITALLATGQAVGEPIALVADRVIDGVGDKARTNTVVVVDGERIIAIGDRSAIPAGARVIELRGQTLMPGFINCHEHPLMYGDDYQNAHLQASSAYKALMGLAALQRMLLAGWTSVRVMGDADVYYANQDIRKTVDAGVFVAPRLTGAGHYLSITGGGGDVNYISPEQSVIADGLVVDGPEEVRKAVREEIKFGSDWIKLLVTGAYQSVGDDPRNVAFSPEELEAAVSEANRHNVPVAAHAHAAEGIKQAVAAGVRSIEHGTFIDDEGIQMMASKGTFLVPTIYVGDYYTEGDKLRAQDKQDDYAANQRAKFLAAVGRAHEQGVKVAVGVDLGGYMTDPVVFVREMAVLVEAGIDADGGDPGRHSRRSRAAALGRSPGHRPGRQARGPNRRQRQPARGHEVPRARGVRDDRRASGEGAGRTCRASGRPREPAMNRRSGCP